ncbi:MAG: Fic family protein [Candidatus Micrarchaeota archaeon]
MQKNDKNKGIRALYSAVRIHYETVRIHPFMDGNVGLYLKAVE